MLGRESVFFAVVLITMSAVADSARAQDPDPDQLYTSSTAYRAGFLPLDRADVDAFHATLPTGPPMNLEPSVAALQSLLDNNPPLKAAVNAMLAEQDNLPVTIPPGSKITSIDDLLTKLNHVITRAPVYCPGSTPGCATACPNATIHFPMSALFVYVMFTPTGRDVVFKSGPINDQLRAILQAWCVYLDSPASLNVVTTDQGGMNGSGWLSPQAYVESKLWEFGRAGGLAYDFSDPHWGFASYNAFFHRELIQIYEKDQRPPDACQGMTWDQKALPHVGEVPRPISDPQDPRFIVSANDGTVWRIERNNLELDNDIYLKAQPYSLVDIFNGDMTEAQRYVGGSAMQSFLSGANYHRFHAPVAGVVRVAQIVNGLMFSELGGEGFDPSAGTKSQGYETNVNTRGLIIIDTPDFGSVVVIPVGITEISSIAITVMPNDLVTKGQELGNFSYGGSTLLLLFERGRIPDDNWILEVDEPVDVNQAIAVFGETTSMTTGTMVALVGLLLVGVVVIARRRRLLWTKK